MNPNPHPSILSDEQLESTYEKIANPATAIPELSELKKVLHNYLAKEGINPWKNSVHKAGVEKILATITATSEPNRLTELFRSIGCMYYYFSAPPEFVSNTKDLILANLEHQSGKVRETVKRIIGNWCLHDSSFNKNSTSEEIKDFIRTLVSLIKKNKPVTETGTIENMSPSIYKTLLLAYDEIVRGLYTEQWVEANPELQVYIPYDDFAPVPDRSILIPMLWQRHSCTQITLDKSAQISERAYQALLVFLARASYSTAEVNDIRSHLAMANSHDTELALVEHIIKIATNRKIEPVLLGPIIRELQTFANFKVRFHQEIPFTYVFLSAQAERVEQNIKGSINWNEWFLHVSDVYDAIESLYKQRFQSMEDFLQKIVDFNKRLNLDYDINEERETYKAGLDDARSVTYYIWTWLIQSYPTLSKKTAEKHAALCYGVTQEINQGLTPYSASDLAEFGGWKSPSSMKYSAHNYTLMLQEVVPDEGLLILQNAGPLLEDEYDPGYLQDSPDLLTIETSLDSVLPGFPRYYIVLSGTRDITENEFGRLRDAITEEAKTKTCIPETVTLNTNYVILVIGISHNTAPQDVVDNFIITANGNMPFLRYHSLITNTHIPSFDEIEGYLKSFIF